MPFIAKIPSTGERVDITKINNPRAELKADDLVCQLCGQPMIVRQGMIVKPHFAHKAECTSDYKRHPESPQHRAGKELIAATIKKELPEYSLAKVEYEFPIPEAKRVADVAALFPNGWIVAHECQLASITVEELEQRTEDYLHAGVDVIWWLSNAANTPGNRDWCQSKFWFVLILNYDRLSERKFDIEIREKYEVDYDSNSGKLTWVKYTKSLMLKRCLQIWQKLNNAQIRRGLALQQSGIYSVNGFIGALNSAKAIQKQGKDADAPWVVMDINSLKPYRSKLLPDSGVEAAKRRAREWQKQGLFPSDKS